MQEFSKLKINMCCLIGRLSKIKGLLTFYVEIMPWGLYVEKNIIGSLTYIK